MAVRQRGKSWQVDILAQGKRLRPTFVNKEDAEAFEQKVRDALKSGEPVPEPKGPTPVTKNEERAFTGKGTSLKDAYTQTHAKFWKGTAWGKQTELIYKALEEHFGSSKPIAHIDMEAVEEFVTACEEKGNSGSTINRKLAVLSKMLRHMKDKKLLAEVPKIERQKEGQTRLRWITEAEEKSLLGLLRQWGKDDHADVVTVLIDTGMRNGELWRLEARDVDLKQGLISMWVTKTDKPRAVPMTKRVKEIMERRIGAVTAPTEKLFPYDNHWMRHVWDKARSRMGLSKDPHFIPYICRHTCASRLVQRGVRLEVVRDWLGHTTMQMTMRYAMLAPHNLTDAVKVLETAAE